METFRKCFCELSFRRLSFDKLTVEESGTNHDCRNGLIQIVEKEEKIRFIHKSWSKSVEACDVMWKAEKILYYMALVTARGRNKPGISPSDSAISKSYLKSIDYIVFPKPLLHQYVTANLICMQSSTNDTLNGVYSVANSILFEKIIK